MSVARLKKISAVIDGRYREGDKISAVIDGRYRGIPIILTCAF